MFVEECSIAIEGIICPVTDVGWSVGAVVEATLPTKLIIFEITLIVDSIWVDKLAIAMLKSMVAHTFIPTAFLFIFDYKRT